MKITEPLYLLVISIIWNKCRKVKGLQMRKGGYSGGNPREVAGMCQGDNITWACGGRGDSGGSRRTYEHGHTWIWWIHSCMGHVIAWVYGVGLTWNISSYARVQRARASCGPHWCYYMNQRIHQFVTQYPPMVPRHIMVPTYTPHIPHI